jgi:hypothetical protein
MFFLAMFFLAKKHFSQINVPRSECSAYPVNLTLGHPCFAHFQAGTGMACGTARANGPDADFDKLRVVKSPVIHLNPYSKHLLKGTDHKFRGSGYEQCFSTASHQSPAPADNCGQSLRS